MAQILKMPLDQNLPWYAFTLTLEQASYVFEVYFNTRSNRWRLNILDASENAVLMGIPLTLGRDITGPYHHLRIPPGGFCVLDDSGQNTEATLSSFMLDHSLYYLESQ